MKPRVSVVVAAYKQVDYLKTAIASAQHQIVQDIEVIVSDDSASDEIRDYIEHLGDPRIRYRRNIKNLGIARNHSLAYQEARGEFIANLNHDDFWAPNFLSELTPPLEANANVGVAFSEFWVVNDLGQVLPDRTKQEMSSNCRTYLRDGIVDLAPLIAGGGIPIAMAAVFRSSLVKKNVIPRAAGGAYDAWISLTAARSGARGWYNSNRLSYYRTHDQSATDTRGLLNRREGVFVQRRACTSLLGRTDITDLTRKVGILSGHCATSFLAAGRYRRAIPYLRLSFRCGLLPKNIAGLCAKSILATIKGYRLTTRRN